MKKMIFKTVDGQLTTIFSKIEKINSGFDLTGDGIQKIVNEFNEYNSTQSFGEAYTNLIDKVSDKNMNVSFMFEELAKQGASAKASVKDVYAAILDGNTKGFRNVKATIEMFNQAQQSGKTNAKDFAKAVGESNSSLAKYLSGLNGGKAGMAGYIKFLSKATFQIKYSAMLQMN